MESEAIKRITEKVEEVLKSELRKYTTLVEEVEYWINEHGIELDEETKERVIEEMIEKIDDLIDSDLPMVVEMVRDEVEA